MQDTGSTKEKRMDASRTYFTTLTSMLSQEQDIMKQHQKESPEYSNANKEVVILLQHGSKCSAELNRNETCTEEEKTFATQQMDTLNEQYDYSREPDSPFVKSDYKDPYTIRDKSTVFGDELKPRTLHSTTSDSHRDKAHGKQGAEFESMNNLPEAPEPPKIFSKTSFADTNYTSKDYRSPKYTNPFSGEPINVTVTFQSDMDGNPETCKSVVHFTPQSHSGYVLQITDSCNTLEGGWALDPRNDAVFQSFADETEGGTITFNKPKLFKINSTLTSNVNVENVLDPTTPEKTLTKMTITVTNNEHYALVSRYVMAAQRAFEAATLAKAAKGNREEGVHEHENLDTGAAVVTTQLDKQLQYLNGSNEYDYVSKVSLTERLTELTKLVGLALSKHMQTYVVVSVGGRKRKIGDRKKNKTSIKKKKSNPRAKGGRTISATSGRQRHTTFKQPRTSHCRVNPTCKQPRRRRRTTPTTTRRRPTSPLRRPTRK